MLLATFWVPSQEGRLVALLPGSRRSEIKRHVGLMLAVANRLASTFRDIRFVIPAIDESAKEEINNIGSENLSAIGPKIDLRSGECIHGLSRLGLGFGCIGDRDAGGGNEWLSHGCNL